MHEPVIQSLEEILRGGAPRAEAQAHLTGCRVCRDELAAMKMQSELFRAFRYPADVTPPPGFYARVVERIENQARPSIWSLFGESLFAKRLAYASMSLFVLLGTFVISSTRSEQAPVNAPEAILAAEDSQQQLNSADVNQGRETILVTLASYQE
jgi:anti-sigma factor RsiW